MTLLLIGKDLFLEGSTPKQRTSRFQAPSLQSQKVRPENSCPWRIPSLPGFAFEHAVHAQPWRTDILLKGKKEKCQVKSTSPSVDSRAPSGTRALQKQRWIWGIETFIQQTRWRRKPGVNHTCGIAPREISQIRWSLKGATALPGGFGCKIGAPVTKSGSPMILSDSQR